MSTALLNVLPADRLLAAIIDSSDDAIVSKTLDGIITSWNPAAERVFGYTQSEAVGRHISILFPHDRLHEEDIFMERIRRGKRIEHFETVRLRKDGTPLDISLTLSPIRADSGKIVGASKIARDITAQRKANVARALLASVVDSSDDAIVSKTLEGIITSWNPAAEQIFGYSADEVIGKPITIIFPPDRISEEAMLMGRIRAGERVRHFESVRRRKNGTYVDVSVTLSPIRDADGTIVGASKIARDITEQRRLHLETARMNERLKELDRLKSEFLATMSHELRTPLNSIIGFTGILLKELPGPLNDEQKKQLSMVNNSGRHLLHLIGDLLDLSRIESGRAEVLVEPFDPQDVIDEVLKTVSLTATQKTLSLRTDLELPDRLVTDRKKVFQVLLNFVGNAVKFTEHGEVLIRTRHDRDSISFCIIDTGIGIKPEQLPLLFQAFRQVEGSATRKYEGTGLGLYLCKKLVALLGGTISADSTYGQGSQFRFSIPLQHRIEGAPR